MRYQEREIVPPQTLEELAGPGQRHQIDWSKLRKIPNISAHHPKSAIWHKLYDPPATTRKENKS